MARATWECIVWDGSRWLRFADVVFFAPEDAIEAGLRIPLSVVYVRTTHDLNENGLPLDAPPEEDSRFVFDNRQRKP